MHVTCPVPGLVDEQQKVRTITALAIAALAEAATPYGIESFDSVLVPLWKGIRAHRGKVCVGAGDGWVSYDSLIWMSEGVAALIEFHVPI